MASIESLKAAPTEALSHAIVEDRLRLALASVWSPTAVASWFSNIRSAPAPDDQALHTEQAAFQQLQEAMHQIQLKAKVTLFEEIDLVRPFGSRLAPVSATLFYPTMHSSTSIVTMEKFTPRSLIRKGFPRGNTYLHDTFPIKCDEKVVKNRTLLPPIFGLPPATEDALVKLCYTDSINILLERAAFPSFNLVYGAGNRDGVVRPLVRHLQSLEDVQVKSLVMQLPSIPWPERSISATESSPVQLHTVYCKERLTAVYVELCHPSDGIVSVRRTSKLWHDGCALDALTNFAVHLAGGSVPEAWASFYMSICYPQDQGIPPEKDQFYTPERIWLNSLRGEEIRTSVRMEPLSVPLLLRQRLDAVDVTPEKYQEAVQAGSEKRSFLEMAVQAVHPSNFSIESGKRWMAAQQKRGLEQSTSAAHDTSAATAQEEWLKANAAIFDTEGSRKKQRKR